MTVEQLKKKNFFMPDATRGAIRNLTTRQLEETGTKVIVTNNYIFHTPRPNIISELGGIKDDGLERASPN
jgi:tRNA-guanine family transglycosylase